MAATTAFLSSSASAHPHTQPQTPAQKTAQTQNSSDSGAEDASSVFKAAIFQRLHPRVYLERFLSEDVRPDGRSLGTANKGEDADGGIWRDVSINVGSINTADGSALVRMGGTTIVCGVKAEIAEPDLEKPDEGFLVPNVDLPAMSHPRFKPGPPSDEAQVLSERLFETLTSFNFISSRSLVIRAGKAVWTLYVDATCINYDGNVFDAALLAMVSALMNTKLPKAVYDEESAQTICHHQPENSLMINNLPLSTSFGIFDSYVTISTPTQSISRVHDLTRLDLGRMHILADPTAFEEPLLDSTITIITGEDPASDAELLSIVQQGLGVVNPVHNSATGSRSIADDTLSACIRAAKSRRKELAQIVKDAVGAEGGRQM